jgi:RNA polymerase sigma-70 factor (ECF subfamily)
MNMRDWESAVEEVGPRLFRYFKYKGAQDLASDLTQETFVRLVNASSRYDQAQGPFIAFALGVAQNIWRESLRKWQPSVALDDHMEVSAASDIHQELEVTDQAEKLRRIVQRLPQTQQDILYFYFDEEITTREIAEILSMPEGTVNIKDYFGKGVGMNDQELKNLFKQMNHGAPSELQVATWKRRLRQEFKNKTPGEWTRLAVACLIGIMIGATAFQHGKNDAAEKNNAEDATIERIYVNLQ